MNRNDRVVFQIRYQLFNKIVEDVVLKDELAKLLANKELTLLDMSIRKIYPNETSLKNLTEGDRFYCHGVLFTVLIKEGENIYAQGQPNEPVRIFSSTTLVNTY